MSRSRRPRRDLRPAQPASAPYDLGLVLTAEVEQVSPGNTIWRMTVNQPGAILDADLLALTVAQSLVYMWDGGIYEPFTLTLLDYSTDGQGRPYWTVEAQRQLEPEGSWEIAWPSSSRAIQSISGGRIRGSYVGDELATPISGGYVRVRQSAAPVGGRPPVAWLSSIQAVNPTEFDCFFATSAAGSLVLTSQPNWAIGFGPPVDTYTLVAPLTVRLEFDGPYMTEGTIQIPPYDFGLTLATGQCVAPCFFAAFL